MAPTFSDVTGMTIFPSVTWKRMESKGHKVTSTGPHLSVTFKDLNRFSNILRWWKTMNYVQLICGAENLLQQTSLQCLSTINMVFSDEDKIMITCNSAYTCHRGKIPMPDTNFRGRDLDFHSIDFT